MTALDVPAWNNEKVSIDKVDSLYMGKSVCQVEYSSFLDSLQKSLSANEASGKKPFQDIDFPAPSSDSRRNAEFFSECHRTNPELFERFIKAKTTSKDTKNLDNVVSVLYDASNNSSKRGAESANNLLEILDEKIGDFSEEAIGKVPLNATLKLATVSRDAFALHNKACSESAGNLEVIAKDLLNSDKMETIQKNSNSTAKKYLDNNIKHSEERYSLIDKVRSSTRKNAGQQGFAQAPKRDYSTASSQEFKLDAKKLKYGGR